VNYAEALDHPELFGRWFGGPSWNAWRTVEAAIFGLPVPDLALFKELTGREVAPTEPATETWIIAGRRSAKSRKAATIATFLCTIGAEVLGYRERLAPGERGVVLVLAVDRPQAKITLDYARAYFREIPMFASMVERDTGEGLDLTNRMSLIVAANDFRSIRGKTLVSAIFDECGYWRHELTNLPDVETYRAAKPGLATMPGSMLIGISSPYRRSGLLWRMFKRHWGKPGPVLIVKAATETLNPLIDRQIVADALDDDPEAARAEWQAEFRTDIADFISREVLESLVTPGCYERAPLPGQDYAAFVDAAGGSGSDSYTLGIARKVDACAELVCLREAKPPFSPEAITREFAGTLRSYSLARVTGDRYAGAWPQEQFQKHGIGYQVSDKTKSQIYLEALPLINSGKLDLLDNSRLIGQIAGLERRTARGGKDSVDHAPHGSDDLANSALGACLGALARRRIYVW
jgi:hypothetical protein